MSPTHRPRWLVALTEYAGLTPYTGGIGRHYAALLPAIVRCGVDVDLAVFADAEPAWHGMHEGVRLVRPPRPQRQDSLASDLVRAAEVRRLARRVEYDAIVMPEWGGLGALLPGGAPLVTNLATSLRVSADVAGTAARDLPVRRRLLTGLQNALEDRQIRRSQGVVPISRAMESRNRRLLGALPPAVVVRNCIDVDAVQAGGERAALPEGWPTGGRVVLFLGRLERRKGAVEAATAFGEVAGRHEDARFVFCGASGDARFEPTRDEVLALVGHPERTSLLGHVAGDGVYAAIARADVVVCPSRWEGFGQVALEVKALGRPLIATSGSGFDDFCMSGVDSVLVPPGDAKALAAAVDDLLTDPDRAAALGAEGRAGIRRFTADEVAPDFVQAVADLLPGRLRRPDRPGPETSPEVGPDAAVQPRESRRSVDS